MRKFLVAATLFAMTLVPAAARAGFILEASYGKGYQVSPTPRFWEQSNIELSPGYAPSLPVLSMLKFQLGIVMDIADGSAANKTNLQIRPMVSLVPPVIPVYGRVVFVVNNLLKGEREYAYGGVVGARVGIPSITVLPGVGVFAEVGYLPRSRDYGTESKFSSVVEGRAGAYLYF
ncbi:MAG: hypothetical protein JXP73_16240 [Deltaproteobacteria bacterium]|nr:hypothetical protein [Deltaproteobacteria bacterium]